MSTERDFPKVIPINEEVELKIEVRPHPEDVGDVDNEILAKMNARLNGTKFDELYDAQSRRLDELSIKREKEKLLRVFPTADAVREAFANKALLGELRKEIKYEGIDYDFLETLSHASFNSAHVESEEFYLKFLFEVEIDK
jgi:hypothetical protein